MNLAGASKISATGAPKVSTSAPRLKGISIHPVSNGAVVTHEFHAAPAKQFVFKDPAKMATHLKRALRTEWLHPNVDALSRQIDTDIDV